MSKMDETQNAVKIAEAIHRGAPDRVRELFPSPENLARQIRRDRDVNNSRVNRPNLVEIEMAREFTLTSSCESFLCYDSRITYPGMICLIYLLALFIKLIVSELPVAFAYISPTGRRLLQATNGLSADTTFTPAPSNFKGLLIICAHFGKWRIPRVVNKPRTTFRCCRPSSSQLEARFHHAG